jgi:NAD(P)-dependent dehydrogenase (short-subunit alcohol dehydrogenase family)
MEVRGSSALVTGASRGIGRAIALALAREGARVTAVARTRSHLDALVEEIRRAGGAAVAHEADLREKGAGAAAVARAVEAHGGLQVLVNNAGVGRQAPVAETTDEAWDDVIGTNLTGVFRLTRAALPHLAVRGGHVFMISSLAGQNPIAGMAAYCASKAALDHFTACLMLEVRQQGVKVCTIAPGSVDTGFGGPPGTGASGAAWKLTADDVARAVLDLLHARDGAHLSRVEMRPSRPPQR